jgi:hypothetical protein
MVKRTLLGGAAMSAFDAVDGACSAGSKCCRLAESTRAIQTVAFEVEGIGEDRRGNADKVDPGIGTTRMDQRIMPRCVVVLNFQPVIDLYREPTAKARGWL